jgi:nucleoside-diphosphate-sugar epimerase
MTRRLFHSFRDDNEVSRCETLRALVTGGSGFIGSHLTEALVNEGVQVRILDRRVPKCSGAEWIDGDLRWIGDCDRATRDVDTVFHLAARISVDESMQYVLEYFSDNVTGTINILSAARKNGVRKFIYTSTCEVYGDTLGPKADENHPCNPTSPYAASKFAAERAALSFGRAFNFPVVILRPFNTFGERQKPFVAGAVIPTFVILALQNRDLVIHGDGSQTRDYTYVKDLSQAFILAMNAAESQSVFNVASGVGRSIREIAEQVVQFAESRSTIRVVDDPRGGAQLKASVGDSTKLMSLGWRPKVSFEEALKKTIESYKTEISQYPIHIPLHQ